MNSLILSFIIIGIVGSISIIVFSEAIKAAVLEVLIKITSENTVQLTPIAEPSPTKAPSSQSAEPPKWVPPDFKGPTGEPRIIGPGSNPPNY